MLQKVIKVGNSYALTIPRDFMVAQGITDAQLIDLQVDNQQGKIIIEVKSNQEETEGVVDPEVYKVAKQLLKRYLPAFKELATK